MDNARTHVLVCAGAGCVASGSLQVSAALRDEIHKSDLSAEIKVIETGCLGPCAVGPVAVIYPDGVFYEKLTDSIIIPYLTGLKLFIAWIFLSLVLARSVSSFFFSASGGSLSWMMYL